VNQPFRNEGTLALVASAIQAGVTTISNSPHYSKRARFDVADKLLAFPLSVEAKRKLGNRFGAAFFRNAQFAQVIQTRYTPKGQFKNESLAHVACLIVLTSAEKPQPTVGRDDDAYMAKILKDEVYWFAFKPFPEPDSQRDYFLSHLPCA